MYQALYRSFRPESFDTFLGQEHIVRILKNQISTGSTGHAYLFCGTRGTGKTTTARLLAKALNCTSDGERPCGKCENCKAIAAGNFLDVVEIDAASNNGVDDIRQLRESVNFPPVAGRTKVYIIDEAHMLTGAAANALLKTLEEPPENVVFILATTEPGKLPATILSRCLRMDFRRIPEKLLISRFAEICMQLNVEASPDALALIAANADGSVRDGLSFLDRCISGTKSLTRDDVLFLLGMAGMDCFIRMTDSVNRGDAGEALTELASVLSEGRETVQFTRDWLEHLRNLIIIKYTKKPENVLNLSLENIQRLRQQSSEISVDRLRLWITELSKALADAKWSPRPRILAELAIIRMASVNEAAADRPAAERPATERLSDRPVANQRPCSGSTADRPVASQSAGSAAAATGQQRTWSTQTSSGQQRAVTAPASAQKSRQKPSAADALAMLKMASAADDGQDLLAPDDGQYVQPPDDGQYVQPPDDGQYVQPPDDGQYVQPTDDAFFPEEIAEDDGFFPYELDEAAPRSETVVKSEPASRTESATGAGTSQKSEFMQKKKKETAPSTFGKCEDMSEEEKASLATSFGDENHSLSQDDIDDGLWMEVLHDPGVPIQLQMSGATLRGMNEEEFTIMVSNPIIADRFAAHAAHLEELMALRSGKHRKLVVISAES